MYLDRRIQIFHEIVYIKIVGVSISKPVCKLSLCISHNLSNTVNPVRGEIIIISLSNE